ncbi:GTP-binding protein [Hwanghaeella grinnelliae]|uniref:GTP-binding protein n=1 Tax=Hwanghaeella grinnelliae TaxID=2500179 RepID=A0A437QU17_9PROT|nr:GTP-binding protein [Hwanghaeella grinnelliae]RVU38002.1 GTP-binding protein [Hwanghaeella grinnelliae]
MTDTQQTTTDDGQERLPVSVLTGFLGSGKTTLLKALLKHPDMDETAVVINEFGEVGLDHLLVEQSSEDMVVMDSGCLCCTIRGDLIETLRNLIRRRWKGEIPPFKRLVIETTGLADPAPILHTLMTDPVISTRYRLDGVITTVDAVNGALQLDTNPESVKQAAVADRILLTKTDMMQGPNPDRLDERLRALNPAARILAVSHGDVDPQVLFDAGLYDPATKTPDVERWLKEEAYAEDHQGHHHHGHHHHGDHHHDGGHDHHHDVNRHDDQIRSFCISYGKPIDWDAFVEWIEALISVHGGNLLRIKGILNVVQADGPVAIHGVQHVFHPPAVLPGWATDDHTSKIVMITRSISKQPVEEMLHAFLNASAQDRETAS